VNRRYGLTEIANTTLPDPMNLTDGQVEEEAKSQGVNSFPPLREGLRSELLDEVRQGYDQARQTQHMQYVGDDGRAMAIEGTISIELSATNMISTDGSVLRAPSRGPIMVEIMIKGVPIVAAVSNHSHYTSISASVVKALKLRRVETLRSKQFTDAMAGKRLKEHSVTCLEKLTFSVGGVEVKLGNVVEISPDMVGIGVQLGQDFFLSAAWCIVDAESGVADVSSGNEQQAYARTDGVCSWTAMHCKAESLRYYSRDGKTAHLPLLHFNLSKEAERVNVIALQPDTKFTECYWCCRTFPEGMLNCALCQDKNQDAYYCDERCQKAAWKVHKANKEGH
jgi:hypothetical protein